MRNQASGNRTSLKNEADGIDERAEGTIYGDTADEGGSEQNDSEKMKLCSSFMKT